MNQIAVYFQPLHQQLKAHENLEDAPIMAKYMRDQFPFYGIKSPQRKLILQTFLKEQGKPSYADLTAIVHYLWEQDQREYQYIAMDIVDKLKKQLTPKDLPLLKFMILTKSWWDTVDCVNKYVGHILLHYPEQKVSLTEFWIESDNMWLQRIAIIFQLRYKHQTDASLLFEYCLRKAASKEFFIQKAIGWALREYSKINADAVIDFIDNNHLAPLSKREGLKWLKRRGIV